MSPSDHSPPAPRRGFNRLRLAISRNRTLLGWGLLLLLLAVLIVVLRRLPSHEALEALKSWIAELGVEGPFVFGVVYVVLALAFFPAWILTVAAGALFGLWLGTLVASLAATTTATIAFLIARYFVRDRIRQRIERSPQLAAIDEAIGKEGWKIVAPLRLSPAIPFNVQNYLYGVTSIRFWPYVITSWIAMLPGGFLYVYFGTLGSQAVAKDSRTSVAVWVLRIVGLIATIVVTVYITRVARRAMRERAM